MHYGYGEDLMPNVPSPQEFSGLPIEHILVYAVLFGWVILGATLLGFLAEARANSRRQSDAQKGLQTAIGNNTEAISKLNTSEVLSASEITSLIKTLAETNVVTSDRIADKLEAIFLRLESASDKRFDRLEQQNSRTLPELKAEMKIIYEAIQDFQKNVVEGIKDGLKIHNEDAAKRYSELLTIAERNSAGIAQIILAWGKFIELEKGTKNEQ